TTRSVRYAGSCPAIGRGVLPTAAVQGQEIRATPDNHFSARPDRSMIVTEIRRVGGAGRCPVVCNRIVSPAGCIGGGAPDNHFSAGPHRRVTASGPRCVGGGSRHPVVRAGIVPTAPVQKVIVQSAQDNNVLVRPHRRGQVSCICCLGDSSRYLTAGTA